MDESDVGDVRSESQARAAEGSEADNGRTVDQLEKEKLLLALWQKQEEEWTINHFSKSAFQALCIEKALSSDGTRKTMFSRLKPVVRPDLKDGKSYTPSLVFSNL